MKNPYVPTAAGLYLNYLIHGMGVLLITLNMANLQEQWGTDAAGVSIVISSLGIGKLATIVTFIWPTSSALWPVWQTASSIPEPIRR